PAQGNWQDTRRGIGGNRYRVLPDQPLRTRRTHAAGPESVQARRLLSPPPPRHYHDGRGRPPASAEREGFLMPEIILSLGVASAIVWRWRRLGLSTKTRTYLVLTIALAACVVTAL